MLSWTTNAALSWEARAVAQGMLAIGAARTAAEPGLLALLMRPRRDHVASRGGAVDELYSTTVDELLRVGLVRRCRAGSGAPALLLVLDEAKRRGIAEADTGACAAALLEWTDAFEFSEHNSATWPRMRAVAAHAAALLPRDGCAHADGRVVASLLLRVGLFHEECRTEGGGEGLAEAAAVYGRALVLQRAEAMTEAEIGETGSTVRRIGGVLAKQGDLDGAQARYHEALRIQSTAHDGRHPSLLATTAAVADLLLRRGAHEQSAAMHRSVLSVRAAAQIDEEPDLASSHSSLARALLAGGDVGGAHEHATRALGALPQFHPFAPRLLTTAALVSVARRDTAGALVLLRRALRLREKSVGEDHRAVAVTLFEMARVHAIRGENFEARRALVRALDIFRLSLPPGHELTARAQHALAGSSGPTCVGGWCVVS